MFWKHLQYQSPPLACPQQHKTEISTNDLPASKPRHRNTVPWQHKRRGREFLGCERSKMLPEEFEDELTCPVCLMLFTDPRTLPCGNSHNLCMECAKGLWRSQAPSFGFSITCPVCRVTCPIQNGVERLPLNLALKVRFSHNFAAEQFRSVRGWMEIERMTFPQSVP